LLNERVIVAVAVNGASDPAATTVRRAKLLPPQAFGAIMTFPLRTFLPAS
jgi:hypothetical protein